MLESENLLSTFENLLSASETAAIISRNSGYPIGVNQVAKLCKAGKLLAVKKGAGWLIARVSAEGFQRERPGVKARHFISPSTDKKKNLPVVYAMIVGRF